MNMRCSLRAAILFPLAMRLLVTALTGFSAAVHAQTPLTFDVPGAASTYTAGINNSGQIAGYYTTGSSHHAFLFNYKNLTFSNFDPPCQLTAVTGISDSGQIVGWCGGSTSTGFLYDGSKLTPINFPGYPYLSTPSGISSNGAYIVGSHLGAGPDEHGFVYSGGVYTAIDYPGAYQTLPTGVNNSGTIVGTYLNLDGSGGSFQYNDGVFTTIVAPGATSTGVYGINNSGAIVGYRGGPNNAADCFLDSDGTFTTFDIFAPINHGQPTGINDNGAIVGLYVDSAGNGVHGVLYDAGVQGYINPKYVIMGVTYAPPGGSASSVSYQSSTILGNTSSISKSFTNNVGLSFIATQSSGLFGLVEGKSTETFSVGWTQKTTTSNAVTVNKTSSTTLKTSGVPNVYSPVNHDYDIIWLWLNPLTLFTLPNVNVGGPILWNGFGYDLNDPNVPNDMDVWGVYVGYLNGDFGPLDPQDAGILSRSWAAASQTFGPGQGPGINSLDFPNILQADPFARNTYDANTGYILTLAPGTNPATSTDGRFTAVATAPNSINYPQEGVNKPQQADGTTYSSAYSTVTTAMQTTDNTYTVGFGLDTSFGAKLEGNGFTDELKLNWNLTWENVSQSSNSNTNTQTDTAIISGPPCAAPVAPCNPEYTEPHVFTVYQDNLYGTLMFWPNPYFSIQQVVPGTNTVAAGNAVNYTISTLANAGYNGTSINFNVTGLPAGAHINQGSVAPGNPFTLIVSTTSATPVGSFPLTISATDGSQSYFAYTTLVVAPPATISLASSPNPSNFGQAVNLAATATGSKTPTGTITFNDGSSALGTGVLNSSGVATYTTSSLAVGQHSITAVYGGDANNAGGTSLVLNQTVNAADFAISSTQSSETISAGASASLIVTVTSLGSFSNPISFSCSGLPASASCTFSPSTVTPNGNTATTNLSIATTGHTASLTSTPLDQPSSSSHAICLAFPTMVLGMLGIATPKRRKFLSYALACLLTGICWFQVACGGSGSGGGGGGSGGTGGTPAGTYTVTVIGAAGSTQHTTTVALTVQ
jgi:Bacterial Ig-like domain (group 3)